MTGTVRQGLGLQGGVLDLHTCSCELELGSGVEWSGVVLLTQQQRHRPAEL